MQVIISVCMLVVVGLSAKAQTSGTTYVALSNEKKVMSKPSKLGGLDVTNYLSAQRKQLPYLTKPESADSLPARKNTVVYQVLTK